MKEHRERWRKPTILGPYGEGYCRFCCFVVGLGPDGRLDNHRRGQIPGAALCDGSGVIPPKATPYASRKAMFRVTSDKVDCPGCAQKVPLAHYPSGTQYMRHLMPDMEGLCPYANRLVDDPTGPPPRRSN